MVAAAGMHLHFQRLERLLHERHLELGDRVHLNSTGSQLYLMVKLPGDRGVVLSRSRLGHALVWLIVDPVLGSEPSIWPLDTSSEVLVDAIHAHATARLAGVPVASPWRWHESEPSDMTELADLLSERGVHVQRVAAGNRYFAYGPRYEPKLHIADGHEGAYVEARLSDIFVRVSIKASIGWLVDIYGPEREAWTRVDLGGSLGRGKLVTPGMPRAHVPVSRIADLICDGPKAWVESGVFWETSKPSRVSVGTWSDVEGSLFLTEPALRPAGAREHLDAVLEQLTAFGFGDIREGEPDSLIHSDTYHVDWSGRTKDLSTSEIQRLNGVAAAAGEDLPKRLIVITNGRISGPAAEFADKAKAFVYSLNPATGRLNPLNSRARDLLPPLTEPSRYILE
ncbi:hypothetical protein [Nonomuraea wenchangensis]|uniref:hypothetical protein n=1 Tax=Nonomuraea wenchangensis TaxID=568860 RepID=UPI00379E7521